MEDKFCRWISSVCIVSRNSCGDDSFSRANVRKLRISRISKVQDKFSGWEAFCSSSKVENKNKAVEKEVEEDEEEEEEK